jgi:hypothetical protein
VKENVKPWSLMYRYPHCRGTYCHHLQHTEKSVVLQEALWHQDIWEDGCMCPCIFKFGATQRWEGYLTLQLPSLGGRGVGVLSIEAYVGSKTDNFIVKLEGTGSSTVFSLIYQTTQRHIPEDRNQEGRSLIIVQIHDKDHRCKPLHIKRSLF